jgi:hypothetical protein
MYNAVHSMHSIHTNWLTDCTHGTAHYYSTQQRVMQVVNCLLLALVHIRD